MMKNADWSSKLNHCKYTGRTSNKVNNEVRVIVPTEVDKKIYRSTTPTTQGPHYLNFKFLKIEIKTKTKIQKLK